MLVNVYSVSNKSLLSKRPSAGGLFAIEYTYGVFDYFFIYDGGCVG